MRQMLGDFSIREKNLWFELLVDVVVALYYYPKAFGLMLRGDEALSGAMMGGLITSTVLLAIVISVILSLFLHSQQKPEPMDERDYAISARSSIWSGRVLVAGVLLVIGTVVVQEMVPGFMRERALVDLTPLVIAHVLLVALMLASMTDSVLKLHFYRRGS